MSPASRTNLAAASARRIVDSDRMRDVVVSRVKQLAEFEVRSATGVIAMPEIEGIASAAHDRAQLPVDFPRPLMLAAACGFRLMPVPHLGQPAAYHDGVVMWLPSLPDRRRGYAVLHELAHGLFDRAGVAHEHSDVQRLTLALAAPRDLAMRAIRECGDRAGTVLARRARYVPAWAMRLRVELLRAVEAGRAA